MAELKTKQTDSSVEAFLQGMEDPQREKDCRAVLLALMKNATKSDAKMWGTSIVGFGTYHYKYESGREGAWFVLGFSPRKAALTIYLCSGLEPLKELLARCRRGSSRRCPLIIFAIETGWYTIVAFALSTAAPRAAYLRYKVWIDRAAGGVMAMLGVKLVASAADV